MTRTDHQAPPLRSETSYRDDEEFCDMQRFGIEHSPHFYYFAFLDADIHRHAGNYYCAGLSPQQAGHSRNARVGGRGSRSCSGCSAT